MEFDDHTTLRQINFDPPFSAKKVKIIIKTIHCSDSHGHNKHGRFDLMVKPASEFLEDNIDQPQVSNSLPFDDEPLNIESIM